MKKIITILLTLGLFTTSIFSKSFFSQRFFEIKVDVPVDVSNNVFSLSEIMQKNLVIDLRKIAETLPSDGLALVTNTNPNVGINFNIGSFSLGIKAGVNVYLRTSLSKDIFDFIGMGNKIGDELYAGANLSGDVFAFTELSTKFKVGRFQVYFAPSVFVPVASIGNSNISATFKNGQDGSISLTGKANVELYSYFDINNLNNINWNKISSSMGFDITAGLSTPISSSFSISGVARIPIVPGKLKNKTAINADIINYHGSVGELIKDTNVLKFGKVEKGKTEIVEFLTHRPLKLNLYADCNLIGNLINFKVGGGVGIRQPFADQYYAYPEYLASFGISLIDLLKLGISTEYTDLIYKHQFTLALNIRLVEVATGVSVQSSSLQKSMTGSGFGAFATVCVGF